MKNSFTLREKLSYEQVKEILQEELRGGDVSVVHNSAPNTVELEGKYYKYSLVINNYDVKAISQLLGHASTIITSNVYFDKNQVVIDCTEEVKDYIERVRPKDEEETTNINEVIIENLDTNLMVSKYLV